MMPDLSQNSIRVRMLAVGLATAAVSAVFLGMIWDFLIALFLAAIFSVMASPFYHKVLSAVGGRKGPATAITLITLFIGVLLPTLGLIYIIAAQAGEMTTEVMTFIQRMKTEGSSITIPEWLPFKAQLENAGPQLASKVGELAGNLAGFFVSAASAATKGTASFFLSLFIMCYAMVFFLPGQKSVLMQFMHYSGLPIESQQRLVKRAFSITRATIKGTLVIGIVQGILGGLAFAYVGIQGAAFWGAVMAIASVIPGVGPTLIWVPAVIYLFATGDTGSAIVLGLWCALVVGSIDNILRPTLVGRDTQMPDLLILISTLGGMGLFGAVGLIIGPVIGGLFITMWDIFHETFGGGVSRDSNENSSST